MTSRALVLAPSGGCGGGIERYVEALEWAFASQGVEYRRIDLEGVGLASHARLLTQSRGHLRMSEVPTRLVVAHRALLPAAFILASEHPGCGISLVCHGIEVWGTHLRVRSLIESYLMHRPRVRVVAVSSFTAGGLSANCPATILPPGLSQQWFDTLVDASTVIQRRDLGFHMVTVFRLADWRDKGLRQLLDAVAGLGRPDVYLTVCGSGPPPPELRRLISEHSYCTLRSGLSDRELALELARADLFVLATRTRGGRRPSGEGFGLVLLEAQIAGTPVLAPAHGGSNDAFIDRATGVAPPDEGTESLTKILEQLLKDPLRLEQMGRRAAEWARECFAPENYAPRAVATLL